MNNYVYSTIVDSKTHKPHSLDSFAKEYASAILKKFKLDSRLNKIAHKIPPHEISSFSDIKNSLYEILVASPDRLSFWAAKHKNLSDDTKEALTKAFPYGNFRKTQTAIWLASSLNIKTCLHCNTAFTLHVQNSKKAQGRIYFEFDHYYAKSDYPYLALSFFNLIPSCGVCNRLLSATEKFDHPYQVSLDQLFHIQLENYDPVLHRIDPSSISAVKLKLKPVCDSSKYAHEVLPSLGLQYRYDHFSDMAHEMIWKQQVYTDSYKAQVAGLLGSSVTPETINRILWGNYCSPDDYHKRPLSKFTTDICRQLKVL